MYFATHYSRVWAEDVECLDARPYEGHGALGGGGGRGWPGGGGGGHRSGSASNTPLLQTMYWIIVFRGMDAVTLVCFRRDSSLMDSGPLE